MPRTPRIQFEGAFYHVFHRGNRRERIFIDARDYLRFETMLLEAVARSRVKLFRWSLLPNHFHLLLETPEGNLADFMRRLLTRYAMYFNWRYKLVGHVFQGRYGARLCDKEAYFLELIRYVELNPYRRKTRTGIRLGDWKWSSHRYMTMPKSQWPPVVRETFQETLDRFGNDPEKARQTYAQFLAEGLSQGTWQDFYRTGNSRFLGDEVFVEKMKEQGDEPVRSQERHFRRFHSVEEFVDAVSAFSGFARGRLRNPSRESTLCRWRQALVYVGRRFYRYPVKALAAAVGRDASTGSQILRRLGMSPEKNSFIARLVEALVS